MILIYKSLTDYSIWSTLSIKASIADFVIYLKNLNFFVVDLAVRYFKSYKAIS